MRPTVEQCATLSRLLSSVRAYPHEGGEPSGEHKVCPDRNKGKAQDKMSSICKGSASKNHSIMVLALAVWLPMTLQAKRLLCVNVTS